MTSDYAGIVMEILAGNELLIMKKRGEELRVKNFIDQKSGHDSVQIGDIVEIEAKNTGDRAIDIDSRKGFSTGNIPAVVEDVFDDTAIVRHEKGLSTINNIPDDIKSGETIEVTAAWTYHDTLSSDAPDIDELTQENDEISEGYEWRYDEEINVSLDDIGGLDHIKRILREQVIQPLAEENDDLRDRLNITQSQGLLFYGSAGTGKTRTAKSLTNEVDGDLFLVDGPELVSKYYGETERQIRNVFEEAEKAAEDSDNPSIIFFDELDSMAPSREEADETERRIVAQLLSELDGFDKREDIIVIGATNLIDEIDQAILRPGRFDTQLEFSKPEPPARKAILEINLDEIPTADNVDITQIVEQTTDFTGADLAAVVEQAKYIALRDSSDYVRMEDLQISVERRKEASE